jgi:hypothetical protein
VHIHAPQAGARDVGGSVAGMLTCCMRGIPGSLFLSFAEDRLVRSPPAPSPGPAAAPAMVALVSMSLIPQSSQQ